MKFFLALKIQLLILTLLVTTNILAQQFTEQTNISLTEVDYSSAEWGDYDNDGDLDILISGRNDVNGITRIYRNDRNNIFTSIPVNIIDVYKGSVDWGDYDNDGDLDILICGLNVSTRETKIYENVGGDSFQLKANLVGAERASVEWGDYDNDGDLDVLLTGESGIPPSDYITRIYRNDSGNFVELDVGIPGVYQGGAKWGDIDSDMDLDIFLFGTNASNQTTYSTFYINDNGIFTELNSGIVPVYNADADLGDFDNDGDLDLILSGTDGPTYRTHIYQNDGGGTFSEFVSSVQGHKGSSVAWGDYDNDGDLDFILSGYPQIISLYENVDTAFVISSSSFIAVEDGSIKWGDYDNDGDLDLLITGWNDVNERITSIYRNDNVTANIPPQAPTNLGSTINGYEAAFIWDKSTDNETSQDGLKYNLVIGTSPNSFNVLSPMSDMNTGYRRVVGLGNTNHNNSWLIKELNPGTYYWSVQAIDQAFAGSEFAEIDSFTIVPVSVDPENISSPDKFVLSQNYPNPFNPTTTIKFQIPELSFVTLKVYDVIGTEVATLVNAEKLVGNYEIKFNATGLPSGIYFYSLRADSFVETKKMVLMK